jgi:spermidine synthase
VSAGIMPGTTEDPSRKPQAELPEQAAVTSRLRWYFYFFFASGFCSILYELIWLRLAMAQFGVTTAMVSIVLSTFMAGLGLGSWAAGHLIRRYAERLEFLPLQLYAITEILIGCSAVIVPLELQAGRFVLEHLGNSLSLSSSVYYVAAGVWLACTLIPWCSCMGATIPLGMFAIRGDQHLESQESVSRRSFSRQSFSRQSFSRRSFSFLYLANVLGAVAGTVIPLLFIEIWGFTRTLQIGMLLNVAICAGALRLASRQIPQAEGSGPGDVDTNNVDTSNNDEERACGASDMSSVSLRQMLANPTLWLLLATGLTSMGMEVVWTRLYTIYVGTLVYSFAMILGVYLAATFIGSKVYRRWSQRHSNEGSLVWLFVWLAALVPLLTADPRVWISGGLRVPLGIAAFSGLLGFLTPKLVDRFSEGDPNRAGVGYAVNVAGCILGPLVAGFVLLPYLDERYALVTLALPWLLVGVLFAFARQPRSAGRRTTPLAIARSVIVLVVILSFSFALVFSTQSYVQQIPGAEVRRDSTATVIAAGHGMDKQLYVNGVAMTVLTPITKMMAAMPLAFLDHPPQNALVICFGMGTTHRSMLSWGIDSTAVDLVPSVPALFWYYHADAPLLLESPDSHVVIDDGRRFLERTTSQYDVIVIDPPPPIGAAGSSLLYSVEFYSAAKKRLRPDGILVQWYPGGDHTTTAAVSRALKESFHCVRAFGSFEGWGVHYLASQRPIPDRSAADLANRMPPNAAADLVEWGPFSTPEQQFAAVLKNEIPIELLVGMDKHAPAMQDDRPVNEYGLLRHAHFWPH